MKANNPKIQNIVEAISRNEISVALQNINSLLSKQKNKEKLSPDVLETIQLLRGLCQIRSEQFGDAREILREYIKANEKNPNVESDLQTWLSYIASGLAAFQEVRTFLEPLQAKKITDEKTAMNQLGLVVKTYDWKSAQMTALKIYKELKQPKFMLASIYFNYRALVNETANPADLAKALELPNMFLVKLKDELKIVEETDALSSMLNRQVIKLWVEILDKQNKKDKVLEIAVKFSKVYEDDYEKFFLYLLRLYEQDKKKEVRDAILAKYSEIFLGNNNPDTYRLCFNLYQQLTSFLISEIPKDKIVKSANIVEENVKALGNEEGNLLYSFPVDAEAAKVLGIFWKSVETSLTIFEEKHQAHQQYRNAVKTLLTCKLDILKRVINVKIAENKSINVEEAIISEYIAILKQYSQKFLKIFTFPDEIFPFLTVLSGQNQDQYLAFLQEEVGKLPEKSFCVGDVNYLKLKFALKGVEDTIEEVEKLVYDLIERYTKQMKVLYDDKKIVEKGERMDNDEYIVVAVDLVIKLMDQKGLVEVDEKMFRLIVKTLYILEIVLQKTPYNFDLKLKAMQLYGRFSVTEKMLDIYKTMDIKSVQTDTLGYIFYNLHASLNMLEPITDYMRENIKFHVENQKEARESLIACIKHENVEKIDEFVEWDKLMQRSYFRHISFLHFAENELRASIKKEASSEGENAIVNLNLEYYLEKILERFAGHESGKTEEKFTLNFDVKTMQRTLIVAAYQAEKVGEVVKVDDKKVGKLHVDYLSVLNNPLMLGLKANRLNILYNAVKESNVEQLEKLEKNAQQMRAGIDKVTVEGFFDFKQFARRSKETALLSLEGKEGYEYEYIRERVGIELENFEFEYALTQVYTYWQAVVLKKEEKDIGALLKIAEEKFDRVITGLEKAFVNHKNEPWRLFNVDLRTLARVAGETVESLEIIGSKIQGLKSAVAKAVKKFDDAKLATNNYKETQMLLKSLKERVESAFGNIGGVLGEVSEGLKGETGKLLESSIVDVEKLFAAEVYGVGQVRKNFLTEVGRSFEYLITTFLARLKEKSKGLKALAA